MFSPTSGSQIFGFAPNTFQCYAVTSLLQHKKTLFAFASDNNIFIFDRLTFKSQIITVPVTSSDIISITFTGYDDQTSIFCVTDKGIFYSYLLSDTSQPIMETDIGFIPSSITASNDFLFCKTGALLYAIPITQNKIDLSQKKILSETLLHDICVISPCGRCLATYKRGNKYPVLWYAPYERRRRANLPIDGHILSFEWGTSDRLLGITSTAEGIVRLWEESTTSYEIRCVKWFDFGCPVISAAIVISADVETQIQLKSCQKAASNSGRVFPAVKRPKVLILATINHEVTNKDKKEDSINETKKSLICILQERKRPELASIGRINLNFGSAIATYCDMKQIFSEGELKRLISTVRYTETALEFYQFELGHTKVTHSTPFIIPFIQSPITYIEKQAKIVTQHEDGSLYSWWKLNRITEQISYIDTCSFQEGLVKVTKDGIDFEISQSLKQSANSKGKLSVSFEQKVSYATIMKFKNECLIAATNNDNVYINILISSSKSRNNDNSFKPGFSSQIIRRNLYHFVSIPVNHQSKDILSVAIHSSDMFVLSTKNSVDAYFYNKGQYTKIASIGGQNACALFIPHPLPLIIVSFDSHLKFYLINHDRFVPLEELDNSLKFDNLYPSFTTMNITENGTILAATKHGFYELRFTQMKFPLPYELTSNFILCTSFTLAYFYLIYEMLNERKLTMDSYRVKMSSESFAFPSKLKSSIPTAIAEICKNPPQSWDILDENGMRFVFSYRMAKSSPDLQQYIQFFGIWALLSNIQSQLVTSLNPESAKVLFDMNIHCWVKDNTLMRHVLLTLIEKTIPADNEVDTYLLFAVLLNKFAVAKRIARIKNEQKLYHFFEIFDPKAELDHSLSRKIEKSAFEAQKTHRNALASMFFYLKGMKDQAMMVLRDYHSLHVVVSRVLGENDWYENIPETTVNGFYKHWWRYFTCYNKYLVEANSRSFSSDQQNHLNELKKLRDESLRSWQFTPSNLLSIEMHRYEMLKTLDALQSSDILSLQFMPGFITMQSVEQTSKTIDFNTIVNDPSSLNETSSSSDNDDDEEIVVVYNDIEASKPEETKSASPEVSEFNFGGMDEIDIDSSFSNEEEDQPQQTTLTPQETKEKPQEERKFESNFSLVCQTKPYDTSISPVCVSFNEKYVGFLISNIINESYDENTIQLITEMADRMYHVARIKNARPSLPSINVTANNSSSLGFKKKISTVVAIIFILAYTFSKANVMISLLVHPLDIGGLRPIIAEFLKTRNTKPSDLPNILKPFVEKSVEIYDDDRKLANFISFHEICKVLLRQGSLSKLQMLISFFHHRHRLLFNQLKSFCFTEPNFILDLGTIGIQCEDVPEKIRLTMMKRKWLIAIESQFISPFYFGDRFQCSKSFEKISARYKPEELSSSSSSSSISSLSEVNQTSEHNTSPISATTSLNRPISLSSTRGKQLASQMKQFQMQHRMTNSNSSVSLLAQSHTATNSTMASSSIKISPPSIIAVCINSQNYSEIAIGGPRGVEFIDLSKPDAVHSSSSNPNLALQPSASTMDILDHIDIVDESGRYTRNWNSLSLSSQPGVASASVSVFKAEDSTNLHKKLNDVSNNPSTLHPSPREQYKAHLRNRENKGILSCNNIDIDNEASTKSANAEFSSNNKFVKEKVQIEPFDSPFVSLMIPAKVKQTDLKFKDKDKNYYQKRAFQPSWFKDRTPLKELDVTCMASHPREPYLIIGTTSGRIYMASFGRRSHATISSVIFNESYVESIDLNETGDRLLVTTEDGYIYVSNFKTANLYVSVKGATAAWLNNDTQIIVCEPMTRQFVVYDLIAGLAPVAIYKFPSSIKFSMFPKDSYSFSTALYSQAALLPTKSKSKSSLAKKYKKHIHYQTKRIPIAVRGHQVLTGYEDGTVVQFDLRSQDFVSYKLHESPVTVLKFDSSQRFFISGSADNQLKVVNAQVDSTPQTLKKVFSTYDQIPDDEPKGVLDIAISDQSIVAVGYSPTIHAWTMNEPRGLYM